MSQEASGSGHLNTTGARCLPRAPDRIWGWFWLDAASQLGFCERVVFSSSILPSQNVICLQAKDTIFIKSNIVASSTKAVLQEIYTTANPDFSLITLSQNDVELNSKDLLYKDNNYTFSIID